MKFGVCLPNYGEACSVESFRELALEAERLGYQSVWLTDHILVTKKGISEFGPLPDITAPYARIYDTLTSLGYLSGVTKKINLGTSVMIIALRNPVIVAKQLATADTFSGGRIMLGIGTGYNEPEFKNLGVDFHNRGKRVSESIQVIRTLWEGKSDFHGTYTRFEDASFEPLPVQKELPIWVGGTSTRSMQRAISLGNAWHPTVADPLVFDDLVGKFRSLPNGVDKPICVRIGLNSKADEPFYFHWSREKRAAFCANKKKNQEMLSHLEKLGVNYAVLDAGQNGSIPLRDQIDSIRMFANDFLK